MIAVRISRYHITDTYDFSFYVPCRESCGIRNQVSLQLLLATARKHAMTTEFFQHPARTLDDQQCVKMPNQSNVGESIRSYEVGDVVMVKRPPDATG